MDTYSEAAGTKPKNRALAGVGIPMKFSFCFVSILNRANLTADSAGTKKTAYFKYDIVGVWNPVGNCEKQTFNHI